MTDESQERAHATRSPSGSHGWRRCPGKIQAEAGLPDRVGREAAEGTIFHEHAELALRLGLEPESFETGLENMIDGHRVAYDEEMVNHMGPGLEYIYNRMDIYRAETGEEPLLFVETRVRISTWTLEKDGFGTSDVIIIFPRWKLIIVFDWKYGKIAVSPVKNDQLTIYGLGSWETVASQYFPDIDPFEIVVELTIWQPRIPGGGGTWPTTMGDLLAEGEQIKIDAAKTYEPNAPRIPGPKQCQYCKRSGNCPEQAQYNLEQYSLHFDDIDDAIEFGIDLPDPDIDGWTDERKAFVLLHKAAFERWFKKLHEQALLDSARGQPWPMMKVVSGNAGHRAWEKGKEAEVQPLIERGIADNKRKKEKPSATVTKLITPAVAEAAVGKKYYREHLAPYTTRPPGKPIVVPETDPRDAIPTLGQQFDEAMLLEDEDENGE